MQSMESSWRAENIFRTGGDDCPGARLFAKACCRSHTSSGFTHYSCLQDSSLAVLSCPSSFLPVLLFDPCSIIAPPYRYKVT